MHSRRTALLAALLVPVAALPATLLTGCSARQDGPTTVASAQAAGPTATVTTPIGLATVGGRLWVASADTGSVVQINPDTGRVEQTVPVGATPLRMAADGDLLWVSVFSNSHLVGVDTTTHTVVKEIVLDRGTEGVAVGFGSVWVVRQHANEVTRLNRDGTVLTRIPVDLTPRLITAGTDAVWVSNYGAGTLSRIDPAGNSVRSSAVVCAGAQGLVEHDGVVWVSCTRAGEVVAVDAGTLAVLGRVAVPGEPDGIRVIDGRLFVVATAGPTLVELTLDPIAPTIKRSWTLGNAPALADRANLDLIGVGQRLWVTSFRQNRVLTVTPS
jgi:YVTN family beta-propeller protein